MKLKTVLVVWATSFTGGTWLALVAASQDGAIYFGNPKRLEDQIKLSRNSICQIEGESCEFWKKITNNIN